MNATPPWWGGGAAPPVGGEGWPPWAGGWEAGGGGGVEGDTGFVGGGGSRCEWETAAVGLMVIPVPIVSVLFQRGAFTAADTLPTALAVAVYGAGLPAFVMQKVLSPLYYAREDTRSPFRFALNAMLVNAALALGLAPFIGFIAAALGTTVAGWVMFWQLWRGTKPMGDMAAADPRLRRAAPRIALASVLRGAVLLAAARLLAPALHDPLHRYPALALLVALGLAAYAAAVIATGGMRLADLRAAMRRTERP